MEKGKSMILRTIARPGNLCRAIAQAAHNPNTAFTGIEIAASNRVNQAAWRNSGFARLDKNGPVPFLKASKKTLIAGIY
jgi:hypothetical protein